MAFAKYTQLVGLASLLLSTLPGISAFDRSTDLGGLRLDHHSFPFSPLPSLPPSKLPPPSANLLLKYVLLGRGTQNYTCSRDGSPPMPNGALARLYDLSCHKCPRLVGNHFFSDPVTPAFFLKDGSSIVAEKIASMPAPISVEGNENGPAIDWLKLVRKNSAPYGGIAEVFRVETAGGRPATACTGDDAEEIDYSAQYWMYG